MSFAVHAPLTSCRSCNRPIFWGESQKTGKAMPMNPEPRPWFAAQAPAGNCVLTERAGLPPLVRVLEKGEERPPGAVLYTAHFATCPQAKQHQSKKCPVPGCTFLIRRERLLCRPHWDRVPAELQRELTAGPEAGCPVERTPAWWRAMDAAVRSIVAADRQAGAA